MGSTPVLAVVLSLWLVQEVLEWEKPAVVGHAAIKNQTVVGERVGRQRVGEVAEDRCDGGWWRWQCGSV